MSSGFLTSFEMTDINYNGKDQVERERPSLVFSVEFEVYADMKLI